MPVKGSTTSELARQPEATTKSPSDVTVKTPAVEQITKPRPSATTPSESATTPSSAVNTSSQGGATVDTPTPTSSTRGKSRNYLIKCSSMFQLKSF